MLTTVDRPNEDGFSRSLVLKLIEQLEMNPLPGLTPNEHAQLLVLIQTTLEVRLPYIYVIASLPHLTHRLTNNAVRWMPMDYDMLSPCAPSIFSTGALNRILAAHSLTATFPDNLATGNVCATVI